MGQEKLNIFIYLEYRKYLSDYYAFQKTESSSFSFRAFSEKAGFNTPNFLQLLIQGKRNIKQSSIPRVARALGLSPQEATYFDLLVRFDQAKTVDEKSGFFTALQEVRKPYQISTISQKQFEHLSTWYHKAIRELLGFFPFDEQEKYAYRKLATMLSPAITESQARKSVKLLLELGLLERDANGKIRQADRFISTGDEVSSVFIRKFHQSMIDRARESVDRFKPAERDVSSITVSISDNGSSMLKQEIQLFRKRLLEMVKADSNPRNVYQVNFQMFPLTNTKKTRKGAPRHAS